MLLKARQLNEWVEKNSRMIVFLFFVLFFVVGLSIYKDYGISWDEDAQWHDNGYANYNFIVHNDKETLLNGVDKYHGPAFELLLIGIEKSFKLSDSREIFLMRHLVVFITFFFSTIFFFLMAKKILESWRLAFVGLLLYVLSPHIFAHSFYNSKDVVFLAFFTISIYTLICFHEKPNYKRALLYAFITSVTIDIRIIGILIPAISALLILIDFVGAIKNKTAVKSKFFPAFLYFISLVPLIILFWPVLWIDPIHHFMEALKENSCYPWNCEVLYFGKIYKAPDLPWHYVLYWMFISKPIVYSVLFLTGAAVLFWSFIKHPITFILTKRNETTVLIWFFLPLMAVLIFNATAFDTGRHIYFLNGAFVLIALYGLQAIYKTIKENTAILYSIHLLLFLSFGNVLFSMIKIHPYQNLYFNFFGGRDMDKIKSNFEFDYWGLASRDVLENILLIDNSKHIKIFAENSPGKLNARILTKEQRERLEYVDTPGEANYYIADYRWRKADDYLDKNEAYSAMIGNAKMITAFKTLPSEELYKDVKGKIVETFSTDFDALQPVWGNNAVVQPICGAHSGHYAASVDSVFEYSSGLTISNLDYIYNRKGLVLKTSFWEYYDRGNGPAEFVVSINQPNGNTYFWAAINVVRPIKDETEKKWKNVVGAIYLPIIKSKQDELKIYLWNVGKNRIFIDDVKIDFIEKN